MIPTYYPLLSLASLSNYLEIRYVIANYKNKYRATCNRYTEVGHLANTYKAPMTRALILKRQAATYQRKEQESTSKGDKNKPGG